MVVIRLKRRIALPEQCRGEPGDVIRVTESIARSLIADGSAEYEDDDERDRREQQPYAQGDSDGQ
jgi:hypothetical protein